MSLLQFALYSSVDTCMQYIINIKHYLFGKYLRTFGKVIDVVSIEASHGDPSITRHVDVRLLGKGLSLSRVQPGKAVCGR